MNTRAIESSDLDELKRIHSQYFRDEFDFPSFLEGFNCSFLIEDDNNIIVAGGIRPIAEVVAITNKSLPNKIKIEALKEFLNVSKYIGDRFRYESLHAFIQDDIWLKQLMRNGFQPTKGRSVLYHL